MRKREESIVSDPPAAFETAVWVPEQKASNLERFF